MSDAVLRVALAVPLPRLFDYLPPHDHGIVLPGCRVEVPFGRTHRIGIVVEVTADSEWPREQLKPARRALDTTPLLDGELLANLQRAADYWCGAVGEVLFGALPAWLREGRAPPETGTEEIWRLTVSGHSALDARSRRGSSLALLQRLAQAPASAPDLGTQMPGWRAAARRLHEAGLIECACISASPAWLSKPRAHELSEEQRAAVAAITAEGEGFHPWLLEGVTGSGKTEVYLSLVERALAQGRQTLWLVPEIGLVPQALHRLRARFDARIAVLHSNLAEGKRASAWSAAQRGEAAIVLGTRSAVFAPLPKAGLIVVDEEHDASYKQQEGFRYHARDFAVMRSRTLQIPILLGSATPSLETLANVEAGRYRHARLRHRVRARAASPVHVLDLRGLKMQHGLSPALLDALDACIARGEQALVFRNRLGYAPVLLCHACGWFAACTRCERPLTVHRGRARLACHHCGWVQPLPDACPQCHARALMPQGHGTERLEEALRARYPNVPVLRVDRESTRRRDAFEALLDELAHDKPAILVGTQMLAKGHDLPNLTMVAIVGVDEGLHSIDFHAGEKLAQLVVQVAGRAGRADKPGEVWLQTHEPEHPLLATLLRGGYPAAAREMLDERRALELPPFAHMVLLRVEAADRDSLDAFLDAARNAFPADDHVRANDPMPAPMPLRAGRHRAQLLVESATRAPLRHALSVWWPRLQQLPQPRTLRWSLDVDPVDLY
ncbi:MAG TPA: primosomal protein N' [Rhodanobacteraceae bacterium]|nr:primosomal protein N' [Rhodanobacteraceae bacterium]